MDNLPKKPKNQYLDVPDHIKETFKEYAKAKADQLIFDLNPSAPLYKINVLKTAYMRQVLKRLSSLWLQRQRYKKQLAKKDLEIKRLTEIIQKKHAPC